MARQRYAAGNWKMNGVQADLGELATIATASEGLHCIAVVCLPATLLAQARAASNITLGAQDCHVAYSGAHTGDISAQMLADAGARYVILGHSERRTDHNENDATVAAKAQAAWAAGLTAIICIGESAEQHKAGRTLDVLAAQIAGSLPDGATPENTVLAYEPIWAIGTGLTPTADDIQRVHSALRTHLPDPEISILYGGSVKAANASEIFALSDVDGGLVGGASLKAADFIPIMQALSDAPAH